MEQTARLDNIYSQLGRECGDIHSLIKSFVGFLLRRTDFFYEADPGDKMGFPPGEAERIYLSAFKAAQAEHFRHHPQKSPEEYARKLEAYRIKNQKNEELPVKVDKESPAPVKHVKSEVSESIQSKKGEAESTPTQAPSSKPQNPVTESSKMIIEEQKGDSKFKEISTYNGGRTERYIWSQSVTEVTVQVNLRPETTKKSLKVSLESNHISVSYVGGEIIVEGKLFDRIKATDSMWTIEDGNTLVITMEKAQENIWKTVVVGDEEIDTTKVDNSKKLEEFDGETQAALKKVMYEQDRKNKGLPTTDEEKQLEMLKKAWNAEGSPFKGTPFDPTQLNIPTNQFMPPQ